MPRIRSLKPEIWNDEALGGCHIGARLLYVALITQADDHGRFRAAPALVRGTLFPYDDSLSNRRVEEWLGALADAKKVTLYIVRGERFGCFPTWTDHQRVDNAGKALFPGADEADAPSPLLAANRGEIPLDQGEDQGTGIKDQERAQARDDMEDIFNHWVAQPAVISHKKMTTKMRRALKQAQRDWDTAEITQAIGLYATVLGSPKHYWSHSWTLDEFLTRGLQKFVPEAQPLTVFFGDLDKGPAAVTKLDKDELRARNVTKCRERYRALVADGMHASEAELDLMGVYADDVVTEALGASAA